MIHARTALLAACSLLALVACGPSEPPSTGPAAGGELYASQGCPACHKTDGRGGALGPSLVKASDYWTRQELAAYLADPAAAVASDARLVALERRFNMTMPAVGSKITEEQRLLLADWVLGFRRPE